MLIMVNDLRAKNKDISENPPNFQVSLAMHKQKAKGYFDGIEYDCK